MILTCVLPLAYYAPYACQCISRHSIQFYDFNLHFRDVVLTGFDFAVWSNTSVILLTPIMFSKSRDEPVHRDLSTDLHDELDWKPGSLQTIDIPLDVTTLAVEPIAGLLAAGKSRRSSVNEA